MTTTVAQLISSIRNDCLGNSREQLNRLTSSITTSSTALTFDFDLTSTGIAQGRYLEHDDEVMYVWEIDQGSRTATVQRAQAGTTASAHAPASIFRIDPRFFQATIRQEIAAEIISWPNRLYGTASLNLTTSATESAVDLAGIPSTFIRLLEVLRSPDDTLSTDVDNDDWVEITGARIERNLDTATFPSGSALFLPRSLGYSATLRVIYAKEFDVDPLTDAIILETDVGLSSSMVDIARMGADWRLLSPREIRRTDKATMGESRTDTAIPPGYTSQSAARYKANRDDRIRNEVERLYNSYGWEMA